MANYIISDAGSGGNFNGTFVFNSGYLYENSLDSTYTLYYDSDLSQWNISHNSDIYYYNTAGAGSPPLSGWLTSLGSEPAPTISIVPPKTIFNTKNLFLKSLFENNVSFYIKSSVGHVHAFSLYLKGNTQEQTDLYLKSFPQSSINFFIKYLYEYQDNKQLYLKSFVESSVNLFIKNLYLYTQIDRSINFNIQSSTIDQQINSVELYVKSFFENNLDLFLMVDNTALTTNFIYTYISGQIITPYFFQNLSLYLNNKYISNDSLLNLTIIGLGTTFNGIPTNSSVQMFIERDIEATWNSVGLITYGSSTAITNSIDFNIYPNNICFESVELVIPEINQPFNANIQLYTHGFED